MYRRHRRLRGASSKGLIVAESCRGHASDIYSSRGWIRRRCGQMAATEAYDRCWQTIGIFHRMRGVEVR
eukprot:scaffold191579_cov72-Cyclotella_meneghiniana.AAC.5